MALPIPASDEFLRVQDEHQFIRPLLPVRPIGQEKGCHLPYPFPVHPQSQSAASDGGDRYRQIYHLPLLQGYTSHAEWQMPFASSIYSAVRKVEDHDSMTYKSISTYSRTREQALLMGAGKSRLGNEMTLSQILDRISYGILDVHRAIT